jgi:hypothetical protein
MLVHRRPPVQLFPVSPTTLVEEAVARGSGLLADGAPVVGALRIDGRVLLPQRYGGTVGRLLVGTPGEDRDDAGLDQLEPG